jgi:hypothetical protein
MAGMEQASFEAATVEEISEILVRRISSDVPHTMAGGGLAWLRPGSLARGNAMGRRGSRHMATVA